MENKNTKTSNKTTKNMTNNNGGTKMETKNTPVVKEEVTTGQIVNNFKANLANVEFTGNQLTILLGVAMVCVTGGFGFAIHNHYSIELPKDIKLIPALEEAEKVAKCVKKAKKAA